MGLQSPVRQGVRLDVQLAVLVLLVSFGLIGIAPLTFYLWGVPMSLLTRDPASAVGAPFYVGMLSQAGIFFWAATATICLFVTWILRALGGATELVRFLLVSAMLTLMLAFDDVFLLHDGLFLLAGIPEKAVMLGYAMFAFFWVIRFYQVILTTNLLLLSMALCFFAVSIAADLFYPHELERLHPMLNHSLYEDGAKIAGVLSWLAYFAMVGRNAIERLIAPPVEQQGIVD